MYDYRIIKPENVYKAIEKQGYFYILAKKYYGESYNGPKYIIATDDPHFRERKPELAEMIIMPVDSFLKLAEVLNESLLNDQRERKRFELYHTDDGYYEDIDDPDDNDRPIFFKIKDRSIDPVNDEVELRLRKDAVLKAMDHLKEIPRKRLFAYFFENLTYRQIADREGVSDMSIRESINGAIKKLKKFL